MCLCLVCVKQTQDYALAYGSDDREDDGKGCFCCTSYAKEPRSYVDCAVPLSENSRCSFKIGVGFCGHRADLELGPWAKDSKNPHTKRPCILNRVVVAGL